MKGLTIVAVPLVALSVLTLSVHVFQSERRQAEDKYFQTVQLHREVQALHADLLGGESAIRIYMLQGQDELLEPYRAVRRSLPVRLGVLEKLLQDDAAQLQRLAKMRPMVEDYLEILWRLRRYAAIPGLALATPPENLIVEEAAVMSQIQQLLSEIQREEDQRMQLAFGHAREVQQSGDVIVLGILSFGFLGGIGAVWLLMNQLVTSERNRAEKAVQDSQRQLEKMLKSAEAQALELARSEEVLRHQTRVLQSVLHSMGDGVVVADESGEIILCNHAAGQILEELQNTPLSEWVTRYGLCLPDGRTPCPQEQLPLARALLGHKVNQEVLFAGGTSDPEGTWLSMTAQAMKEETGPVKGGVLLLIDITAQKRSEEVLSRTKEEAERANRAKSEFLSRMSHELRTPLNAILGFAQLLEMAPLASTHCGHVEQILKAGRHLLALINEVLDISRIESGRLELSPEPVLVAELIQETLTMVQPQAAERHVRINGEPATGTSLWVLADYRRLKQVFLNLLSNAVKYNRPGGAVTVTCQETEQGLARIRVIDTGIGIPPEKMDLLFSPFERLGAEQTEVEGTGIGLVLSKRLVEMMGGKIGVNSQSDVGTTFWVELPCAVEPIKAIEKSDTQELAAVATAVCGAKSPTVLCIEDNPSNLRLITHILAQRPAIRLLSAPNGFTGLVLAQEHQPQLILLDVHLPDIEGKEVFRRLRADPRTSAIPVVIVSADATPNQERLHREAGVQDYLTKPLDVKKLLAVVEETLEHARAQ